MIDFLEGCLVTCGVQHICLEVGGVGWRVYVPLRTRQQLPPVGCRVRLYTQFITRENGIELYGFLQESTKEVFSLLTSVSGIGGKVALALLSTFDEIELCRLIETEEIDTLCQVPGVGNKTARRLVLELKDKLQNLPGVTRTSSPSPPAYIEALAGLEALGYRQDEVANRLRQVVQELGGETPATELIRAVLQKMVRRG